MEKNYTKEEIEVAKKLVHFYIDLVENNNSTMKFYLAENVILDWFGKTVKGDKKVTLFMKDQVRRVTHHINNTVPSENVAFRETHHVKVSKIESSVLVISSPPTENMNTPPSSSTIEIGQGDGLHNCPPPSPLKKMRFDEENGEILESENEIPQLKYVTSEGAVEFRRPSIKKLQTENKWKRPVKLHLGYTSNSFKDYTIYLIIYEGNLKCRRNLYKEFCESDTVTHSSV